MSTQGRPKCEFPLGGTEAGVGERPAGRSPADAALSCVRERSAAPDAKGAA
jgi:hypothetical protein